MEPAERHPAPAAMAHRAEPETVDRSVGRQHIPGGWHEQPFSLAGRTLQLLVPADADQFLEHLDQCEPWQPTGDPYWARLWPASVTLAEWIAQRDWPTGHAALELGCGIGLAGLAALLAGLQVTFTDYVPLAVELAIENARRNGLDGGKGLRLTWGEPLPPSVAASSFSVIVASDVIYDPKQHEPLLVTLEALLSRDGIAFIADPGRYHVAAFLARCAERKFTVSLSDAGGHPLSAPLVGEYQLLQLQRARMYPSRSA